MTRVVLDANVLAPGFTSTGSASSRLVDLWRGGAYDLVLSEHLLAELARTFADPYYRARVSPEQVMRTLTLLRQEAVVVELTVSVTGTATQPKDDLVLSTALSGAASILCTRDKQLLKLRSYRSLAILSPGELVTTLDIGTE